MTHAPKGVKPTAWRNTPRFPARIPVGTLVSAISAGAEDKTCLGVDSTHTRTERALSPFHANLRDARVAVLVVTPQQRRPGNGIAAIAAPGVSERHVGVQLVYKILSIGGKFN